MPKIQPESITITPKTASVNQGDKITITATVTPKNQSFEVDFLDTTGKIIGQCQTQDGDCSLILDTENLSGTYFYYAAVDGKRSTAAIITVVGASVSYKPEMQSTESPPSPGIPKIIIVIGGLIIVGIIAVVLIGDD